MFIGVCIISQMFFFFTCMCHTLATLKKKKQPNKTKQKTNAKNLSGSMTCFLNFAPTPWTAGFFNPVVPRDMNQMSHHTFPSLQTCCLALKTGFQSLTNGFCDLENLGPSLDWSHAEQAQQSGVRHVYAMTVWQPCHFSHSSTNLQFFKPLMAAEGVWKIPLLSLAEITRP